MRIPELFAIACRTSGSDVYQFLTPECDDYVSFKNVSYRSAANVPARAGKFEREVVGQIISTLDPILDGKSIVEMVITAVE